VCLWVLNSRFFVAVKALKGAQAIARRKIESIEIIASMMSFRFPNASQWPFVALEGFTETGLKLSALTSSPIAVGMIVIPEQVSEFETFAASVYKDQDYPDEAGRSDFGFGIWATDVVSSTYEDGRIHDTSGNTTFGRKRSILVPTLLGTNRTLSILMYNSYSDELRGRLIDEILDCSDAVETSGGSSPPSCGVLSGFLELIARSGPAAILYQPIYAANNLSVVVGISATSIPWDDLLKDVVPSNTQGLYCVISTEDESYTYMMTDGEPKLLGKGDLHDASYNKYMIAATLDNASLSATSAVYTLTLYPSDQWFDASTSNPRAWAIAMGFVAVIVVSTALFFVYDILMRNESRQQKVILEVKRRFVRFVSHEIRTPLNTVCMGLELLQADLSAADANQKTELLEPENIQPTTETPQYEFLLQTVDDVLENANNAVGILNDLLNYDKMEHGTFKLEVGEVKIWEVIPKTVASFNIQAKKRSMELTCTAETQNDDRIDFSHLKVIGDDVRLRQVIRNVVSNSLKFCQEGLGKIEVSLAHNSDGLPNAAIPRNDLVNDATSNVLVCSYPRAGSIRITLKDNGVGMTSDQLQRLFQEGLQFEPNKLQVCLTLDNS
jgi:signal transduction histidine kinase